MLLKTLCSVQSDEKEHVVHKVIDNGNNNKTYVFRLEHPTTKRLIYTDDTIRTIQYKIAKTLDMDVHDVYLFTKQPITSENRAYVFSHFLRSGFRKGNITVHRLNELIRISFDNELGNETLSTDNLSDNEIIRYTDARKILFEEGTYTKLKNINVPLSFGLRDAHHIEVIFAVNPYEQPLDSHNETYTTNIQQQYSSADLGSFNVDGNEIYVVCKSDINHILNDDLINFYYPTAAVLKDDDKQKSKYDDMISLIDTFDDMKHMMNAYEYDEDLDNVRCKIQNVKLLTHANVQPYSKKKKSNTFMNLKKIFNLLTTSLKIPFVAFKAKTGEYLYRVLNKGLHHALSLEEYEHIIEKERLSVRDRGSDCVMMKCVISDEALFTIIVHDDGSYNLYARFPLSKNTDVNKLDMYIDEINDDIIQRIRDLGIADAKKIDKININVNTHIIELKTVSILRTKDKLISAAEFVKQLDNNAFFSLIKNTEHDDILMKYKRISNYAEMDNIDAFITKNYNLSKDDLLDLMQQEFSMDADTALEEFEKRKDAIPIQKSNKNGRIVYKNKYNEGVYVKLKILNKYQAEVQIQNITRNDYHNNILKAILIMLTDRNKNKFKMSKKNNALVETTSLVSHDDDDGIGDLLSILANDTRLDDDKDKTDAVDDDYDDDDGSNMSYSAEDDEGDSYDDDEQIDVLEGSNKKDDDERVIVSEEDGTYKTTTDAVQEEEEEASIDDQQKVTTYNMDDYRGIHNDEKMMKRYHSRFINERLKEVDPKLFSGKYAKHCGAVDKKQPVVVTKSEKTYIDNHHKGSYTGFIKQGYTQELKHKNYYICPLVWCPLSRVSITVEELRKNNDMCPEPYRETPLVLHKKNDKAELGTYKKYPYLMKPNIHPDQKEMVCCGKKNNENVQYDDDDDDDVSIHDEKVPSKEYNHDRYIMKVSNFPVEDDRLASLPASLHDMMNPGRTIDMCTGLRTDSKNGCIIRSGLGLRVKQKFLTALVKTLGNKHITSVEALLKLVRKKLSLHEYIFMNNGNTMKTYVPHDVDDLMDKLYVKYRKYIGTKGGTRYIKVMCLDDIKIHVTEHEVFDTSLPDNIHKLIKRELIIFASYNNFKNYLKDDTIDKPMEEMYDLTKIAWINPEHIEYIILGMHRDITILCQKYADAELRANAKCVVLLDNNGYYEQLVKLSNGSLQKIREPFSINDEGIQDIISIYKHNCSMLNQENESLSRMTYLKLSQMVTDQTICADTDACRVVIVIDYNIKIVGFLITGVGVYVPLDKGEGISKFFYNEICSKEGIVTYQDNMHKIQALQPNINIKREYKRVIKLLSEELIYYTDMLNSRAPVLTSYADDDTINIFIGREIDDARKQYMHEYVREHNEHKHELMQFIDKINLAENEAAKTKITLVRHELNPYPYDDKIKHIRKVVNKLLRRHNAVDVQNIARDIYVKGMDVLDDQLYSVPNIDHKLETLYTLDDLNSDALLEHYNRAYNPYKSIRNSIEDLSINYTLHDAKMISEDDANIVKHTFTNVSPKNIYVSNKLRADIKATDFGMDSMRTMLLHTFNELHMEYDQKKPALTDTTVLDNLADLIYKHYTTEKKKVTIRYWMNLFGKNKVVRNASNKLSHTNAFVVENREGIRRIIKDDAYRWGVLEAAYMCHTYDIGLIVVAKNKRKPSLNIDMTIRDNMELLLPDKDSDTLKNKRYLICYVDKKKKEPYKILVKHNKNTTKGYENICFGWADLTEKMRNILSRNIPTDYVFTLRMLFD
jgi:hypothetical protein